MLHLQLEIPCGIYFTEQESEEIVAERIKTCIAERRATEARRQRHNAARLSCTRLRRIQKPGSNFVARQLSMKQIKDSLQP